MGRYARRENFLVPLKVTENFSSCIIYRTGESLIPACHECCHAGEKSFPATKLLVEQGKLSSCTVFFFVDNYSLQG